MKPLTTLAIVLACGAAAAAQNQPYQPSQPDRPGQTRQDQNTTTSQTTRQGEHWQTARQNTQNNPRMSAAVTLAPTDWLVGAKVVSANASDSIGTVNDLAVNTGEEKAEFAIVSRGGVLGVGSTLVAVPLQALNWSPTERRFTIAMTEDQFKNAPEFKSDNWNLLSDPTWRRTTFNFFHVNDPLDGAAAAMDRSRINDTDNNRWGRNNNQARQFAQGGTIRGTVQSIQQQPVGNSQGYVCTITDNSGRQQQIHLGPAWFIDHQAGLPQQGDQVEIKTMQTNLYGQEVTVAQIITGPQATLRLRDESGQPVWNASAGGNRAFARGNNRAFSDNADNSRFNRDQNGRVLGAPEPAQNASVYLKASEIKGKDLLAADGTKAGDIHTLVLDTQSGKIAFATVAFGGFLGIGEKDVAVPWELITIDSSGRAHLANIDKDQLRNAPPVDTNWETSLRDPSTTQRIFQHYGLDASWLTQGADNTRTNRRFNTNDPNQFDQNRNDRMDRDQDPNRTRSSPTPGSNTEVGPDGERRWKTDPNNNNNNNNNNKNDPYNPR